MERGSDVLVALPRIGIAIFELELGLDADSDTDPDTDACDKGSRPGSSTSLPAAGRHVADLIRIESESELRSAPMQRPNT